MWQRTETHGSGRSRRPPLGGPARGRLNWNWRQTATADTLRPAARRQWSTRLHLTALVLAVLVPMLAFAAFLLWQVAHVQRNQLQKDAVELAETLGASIDRDLSSRIRVLEVLAASPLIDRRDQEGLYRHAVAIKPVVGSEIIIEDASGQQLVNTKTGLSTALPAFLPDDDKQAIETGQPVISDLVVGATGERPSISVNVPIIRGGTVIGLVDAGIAPERLAGLLREGDLPDDWMAAIVDRRFRIVARSRRHEEFVGKFATKDMQENVTGQRGVWIGTTAERIPVLGAYVTSQIAGWRVAVGVPVAVLEQPLYRSTIWLIGIGAAALAASALLAGFFARRLVAPMRTLAAQAERLGRNEAVQPTVSTVTELSNMSGALEQASRELQLRDEERQQADTALRSGRARLQRLLDTSPVGIVELNARGEFIYVNTAAERILRVARRDLEGKRHDETTWILRTPEGHKLSTRELPGARALAGELIMGTEVQLLDAIDDRRLMLSVNAAPVVEDGKVQSALITFSDTTERHDAETALRAAEVQLRALNETLEQRVADEIGRRQQIEEALRQSQKMEAIGQLTGGVAHDFNNLLTIILGNLENLGHRLPADDPCRRYVTGAVRGASRAAVLTSRLLAFSRRQPLAPRVVDANALIGGMSDLLGQTLGEAIAVETRLAEGLWQTFVDPSQIENALINLAANARDAMPEGGQLMIETMNCRLDETHPTARDAGHYVGIFVSDTGFGMPEDVVAKAFEPFFTTKDIGHGTGLGLSQVYGFIRQSGGHVRIYSQVDCGTVVRLYLPRHLGAEAPTTEPGLPAPRGRKEETVLVVEDDPDVRAYTSDIVNELGYRVLTAADGSAALGVLDAHPEVQLLFTDVGLPGGVNGRQLAEQASKRRPGLRVLYTTGYARDAILAQGLLDPAIEVVFKPFRYAELASKIRRVLDS